MTSVAICTDNPPPSDASAYTACTSVAWIDSTELHVGLFDGFDPETALECAGAVMLLWAVAWIFPQLAQVISRR